MARGARSFKSEAQARAEHGETGLSALAELQPAAHAVVAVGPYLAEHEASNIRAMANAQPPKTLAALVRWARYAYRLEPPVRLHARDTGDDGTPRWSGAFVAWLRSKDEGKQACATDDDGYYRLPFRCALFQLHGRDEGSDEAALADFCLGVAISTELASLDTVADYLGLKPHWAVRPAAEYALRRLFNLYAPLRSAR